MIAKYFMTHHLHFGLITHRLALVDIVHFQHYTPESFKKS